VGARAAVVGVVLAAVALLPGSAPAKRATFPGANGLLVYTLSDLYVVNPDGTGRRAVTTSTPQRPIRAFQPGWAPDGNRIVFGNSVGTSTGGGLWIINADGTAGARIPNTQQNDAWPTFSPDGRQVAFVRFDNRYNRLFVINVDGTGLRSVMPDAQIQVEDPEWSPDGTRFALSNGSDIYTVNADGTGLTNVTTAERSNERHPSWSPDGSRIAFVNLTDLKVIPATGGASTTVTTGQREMWETSWSPDGQQLVFVADVAGPLQEELWVVNADGSNLRRLNVDSETTVDWGKAAVVPPPVAGVSVNVAPVSGTVRVRVRGTNRFVSLARLRNVPVGSELDVTRGRVRLVSAAGAGRTQSGVFYQGRGIVRQARARAPVTTLVVSGPLACPRRSPSAAGATPPPRTRRLWGNATGGRFSTKGRYASAAVRGTIWLTEDRCDGTLIRVTRGTVTVRDLVARRTVTVRAGRSYLARARR
jgi:dipeptidyl aminopeptidase/acylaminoacyl peptidase